MRSAATSRVYAPIACRHWFVESNLSGDKKATHQSLLGVRGRKVSAEVVLPPSLVAERLHTTVDAMLDYWRMSVVGGVMSGSVGVQGHYANGLAAMFIACGQDAACVAEAATGITRFEPSGDGGLYAAVTLPSVIVGTVGGGTGLPSQHACLDIMRVAGSGHARAFAEIVAAVALAGELSITGALAAGDFTSAHQRLARGAVASREALRRDLDEAQRAKSGQRHTMNRWVIYQRERFPLSAHAPLVAAFSASAVCFSSLLRGHAVAPSPAALVVAFTTSLLFFLQLRIADEFKDCEDDARFRPYRPVPRGLVTLPELAAIGVAAAVVQLGLALWLHAPLVWLLVPSWLYLGLMTREFFARRWLKAHPIVYLASHMLILPLIDLYATACDWLVAGERTAHVGLLWFLVVSYLNGIVIEIGRKTRVAADEEHGVETYSALWGKHGAARAWLLAVLLTAAAAWEAASQIGLAVPTIFMLGGLMVACVAVARRFLRNASRGGGKAIEVMAGVWTLLMYLGLGAAPMALTLWQGAR